MSADTTIHDAMLRMSQLAQGIVPVLADDRSLLGVISDGDIRRAILGNVSLNAPVLQIANRHPVIAPVSAGREDLIKLMEATGKVFLPVIDEAGRFIRVEDLTHLVSIRPLENFAVIFAGGKGRRMRPFTDAVPKPMLQVGVQPIIDSIVESVAAEGFNNIVLLLHHMADKIIEHFSGRRFLDREIECLVEPEPWGTAGGLRLMKERLKRPFLVINGDTLIKGAWKNMLAVHEERKDLITIGTAQYSLQIPYGVLETDGDRVTAISEKPELTWRTVCGAYCLSPETLTYLPAEQSVDMPRLVETVLAESGRVGYFPVRESLRIEDAVLTHKDIWKP